MSDDTDTLQRLFAEQEELEKERLAENAATRWDIPVLIVFATLFATVFLQFFTRYVLNDSLSWTEEAARYLLIILTFVGAINCQKADSHIRLEFIDHVFTRHVYHLKLIALTLSTFFFGFLAYALTILARTTSFQKMVSLPFPKYYLYIIIMVELIALVAVHILQIVRMLKAPTS
jgi:TRAP-type C4-dicarboxylate transport system permease small subunit